MVWAGMGDRSGGACTGAPSKILVNKILNEAPESDAGHIRSHVHFDGPGIVDSSRVSLHSLSHKIIATCGASDCSSWYLGCVELPRNASKRRKVAYH